MLDVDGDEEVSIRFELGARPDVPTTGVTNDRMPKSIQRP
jgi:hypothetical protein